MNNSHTINRRTFLRQAACAALGATAMVNTLSYLQLTTAALAQGNIDDDYKALVCVFLAGGNDSNNMLLPAGSAATNPLRKDYEDARGVLAITDLSNGLVVPSSTGAFTRHYSDALPSMAVHPNATEIASLYHNDELAFICNVGTLAEPIETRQSYLDGTVDLPSSLFSHSDQQMEWQTSVADGASSTGWGGRVADILNEAHNADTSKVAMSISVAGINAFQRSALSTTTPIAIGTSGINRLTGFGPASDPYKNAFHEGSTFDEPLYKSGPQGDALKTLENLLRLSRSNLLEQSYVEEAAKARQLEGVVGEAYTMAESSGVDFETHFANAQTDLGDQLKAVAKLIKARSSLGNRRQIFFVKVGGYDIHKEHLSSHAELMSELSTGLMAFRNTLHDMGDWDKVTAFTASDFNRTLTANGSEADAGTDHAWGGHAMVMGGAVQGGDLYGHFPSLKVGDHAESIDAHKGRGRWIPSVSVDQYSSMLARWIGVESSAMEEIFPNLYRFDDPLTSTTPNMQFLQM